MKKNLSIVLIIFLSGCISTFTLKDFESESIKVDNYNVALSKYKEAQNLFPENKMLKQKLSHLNNLVLEKSKSNGYPYFHL